MINNSCTKNVTVFWSIAPVLLFVAVSLLVGCFVIGTSQRVLAGFYLWDPYIVHGLFICKFTSRSCSLHYPFRLYARRVLCGSVIVLDMILVFIKIFSSVMNPRKFMCQNYWVFGLCPVFGILETRKQLFGKSICFRPRVVKEDTFSVGSLLPVF
jgi:hypothetical protein